MERMRHHYTWFLHENEDSIYDTFLFFVYNNFISMSGIHYVISGTSSKDTFLIDEYINI